MRVRTITLTVVAGALTLLTACGGESASSDPAADPSAATAEATGGTVRLLTHDSFVVSQSLLDDFTSQTGLSLEVVTGGDAGTMVAGAVLAAGAPTADVLYGVDNTLISRATDAGVFEPYESSGLGSVGLSSSRTPRAVSSPPSTTAMCASTSTMPRWPNEASRLPPRWTTC